MHISKQVSRLCCLLAVILFSFSCAHLSKENFSTSSSPHFHTIDLPFFPQEKWQCGPASLAGVLNYRGVSTSPDILKEQVFLPQKKGSLQIELKSATRNADLVPYQLEGDLQNLIREIEAGNPVIVLQNSAFNWLPKWHYAVVKGFDADKQVLILNSGTIENYHLAVSTFMNTWKRADFWAITVMPLEQLPATGSTEKMLKEIHVFEQIGKQQNAFKAYQALLQRWPDESQALFSVGNYYFSEKSLAKSQEAFEKIILKNSNNIPAWNNLAYVFAEQQCYQHAYTTLNRALTYADNTEKNILESSMKDLSLTQESTNASHCNNIKLPF